MARQWRHVRHDGRLGRKVAARRSWLAAVDQLRDVRGRQLAIKETAHWNRQLPADAVPIPGELSTEKNAIEGPEHNQPGCRQQRLWRCWTSFSRNFGPTDLCEAGVEVPGQARLWLFWQAIPVACRVQQRSAARHSVRRVQPRVPASA